MGGIAVGGTSPDAAWAASATHTNGATLGSGDGLVLVGGENPSLVVAPLQVDASGNLKVTSAAGTTTVVGDAANGAAVAGNPVLVAGSDGTDARTIATDASGDVKIVQGGVTDGAGTYATVRLPNVFHTAQATASGNTAVWTPTSGKKFRLLRYQVEMTENATLGTAAVLTISFQDATTAIPIAHDVWVPSAAGTSIGDGYSSGWIDLGGLGVLSAAANNALNVNLSAAVTAGNVRVNVAGTEE